MSFGQCIHGYLTMTCPACTGSSAAVRPAAPAPSVARQQPTAQEPAPTTIDLNDVIARASSKVAVTSQRQQEYFPPPVKED